MKNKMQTLQKTLIILAFMFGIQFCTTEKKQEQAINGNFKDFDVKFKSNLFDAKEGGTFSFASGTKISIPKNAFVDQDGNQVKGKVNLNYREFHSNAEIITSGIPMVFDDGKEKHNFESAGMFDIRAIQENGEPVFIANDKSIQVDMASYKGGKFNFYYLNEGDTRNEIAYTPLFISTAFAQSKTQAKWEVLASSLDPSVNTEKKETLDSLDNLLEPEPVEPKEFNENDFAFDFEINIDDFPELKSFEGVIWQYAGEKNSAQNPERNAWIFEQEWTDIKLENHKKNALQYKLVLSNSGKSFETIVSPALKGEALQKAKKEFKQKMKAYKKIQKREADKIAKIKAERQLAAQKGNFMRAFKIQKLGIYNHDVFMSLQDSITVKAKFNIDNDPSVAPKSSVFLVLPGGVVEYKEKGFNNFENFKFSPNTESKIIAPLPDDKVAVFSSKDFINLNLDNIEEREIVFNLKTIDKKITSVQVLHDLIQEI